MKKKSPQTSTIFNRLMSNEKMSAFTVLIFITIYVDRIRQSDLVDTYDINSQIVPRKIFKIYINIHLKGSRLLLRDSSRVDCIDCQRVQMFVTR